MKNFYTEITVLFKIKISKIMFQKISLSENVTTFKQYSNELLKIILFENLRWK